MDAEILARQSLVEDPGKPHAYAFGYGYINALIVAANSEVS